MMVTNEGKRRIGDQQLGVLFDGGKVRCRREWRGVKDTLYDYGRWRTFCPSSQSSSSSRATSRPCSAIAGWPTIWPCP